MYDNPFAFVHTMEDTRFIKGITEAINGEYSAIHCYTHLFKIAPTKEEQSVIREIRRDEKRHFQEFVDLYIKLTGTRPTPRISEQCPKDYCKGLTVAFKDEQKTVDFYLDLSDKATNPHIKDSIRRIASDEQNHAVWFLYFLTKNDCRL